LCLPLNTAGDCATARLARSSPTINTSVLHMKRSLSGEILNTPTYPAMTAAASSPPTAIKKSRIVRLGFGTS
jgi:hypothetical protein